MYLKRDQGFHCERENKICEILKCSKDPVLLQKSVSCTRRHQWFVKVRNFWNWTGFEWAWKQSCPSTYEPPRSQILFFKYHSPNRTLWRNIWLQSWNIWYQNVENYILWFQKKYYLIDFDVTNLFGGNNS